jgi:hypothetical protein
MTWRRSESFVSCVSGSGLHNGCSLAQSSNLSIDFHPVFYALSDVYVGHPTCRVGSCILVMRQNHLLDKTTAYQLEND